MLADTMINMKRRSHNAPRNLERVVSPQQTFVHPSHNIANKTIVPNISSIQVNSSLCSPPRRVSNYSRNSEHRGPLIISANSRPNVFTKTGFSSVKSTIENSTSGISSLKKFSETDGTPINQNIHHLQSIQGAIIEPFNLLHQTQSQLKNNINQIRAVSQPRSLLLPSTQNSNSNILHHEFKNKLQNFQRNKSTNEQLEGQASIQNSQETDFNQYILQLLSESTKTKQMLQRLMTDNQSLLTENKALLIIKQEYNFLKTSFVSLQNDNKELKQQLSVIFNQEQNNGPQSLPNVEKEQNELTVSIMQQQIQMLKQIINNKNNFNEGDFNKIISQKDGEIEELQIYVQDLTGKIKELLMELSRFTEERMAMVSDFERIRYDAGQEIERLNNLLHSQNQGNLTKEVRFEKQTTLTEHVQQDNTRVQISGGYEELVLGKNPSPARIRTATYEIVDGVQIVRQGQYIQSY